MISSAFCGRSVARRTGSMLLVSCLLGLPSMPGSAQEKAVPTPERLVSRLKPVYLQPAGFSPASMRFAPVRDVQADLARAREAADARPADLDARWRAALLAEQAEDPGVEGEWRVALGLTEAALAARPKDPALLERQVRAMVGANVPLRVAGAAEKLVASQAESWKLRLLAGDAYLCRADFNWRVLVKLGPTGQIPAAQLLQMNGDLAACRKAYDRAVELAPAEIAPRAARIALMLARPLMASLLPKGAMPDSATPDMAAVRRDVIELVVRNPGSAAALWHAARFFASQPLDELPLSAGDRELTAKALADARAEGDARVFLAEARGLFALVEGRWAEARGQFETALALLPERRFAAGWLAIAEARSPDPLARVIARARARLAAAPRPDDFILLGVLLSDTDRTAAVDALRKGLEQDVYSVNGRYNLAVLLLRQDASSPEALRHLRMALQGQPDHHEALFASLVYQALQEDPAARTGLERMANMTDLGAGLKIRIEATLKDLTP